MVSAVNKGRGELIAQGTTEYLVIIAVVIVISLVVVSLVVDISGASTSQVTGASSKLGVWSNTISVTETAVEPTDGNYLVKLMNNTGDVIEVSNISVNDSNVYFGEDLAQGMSRSFIVESVDVCNSGSRVLADLTVTYVTRDGLEKKEVYPAKISFDCSNYTANASFLANSCIQNATIIEPNLLPQNIWDSTLFGVTGYWGVHSGVTKCTAWNGSTWINATTCSDVNVPANQDAALDSARVMFDTNGRFVAGTFSDGNKYVRDTWNGIMWWDGHSASTMDWNTAMSYCGTFRANSYSNWRLASVAEAYQSFDYGASSNGGSYACAKGFTDCFGNWVWTSTSLSWSPTTAAHYYPYYGYLYTHTKTYNYYARCVRFEN